MAGVSVPLAERRGQGVLLIRLGNLVYLGGDALTAFKHSTLAVQGDSSQPRFAAYLHRLRTGPTASGPPLDQSPRAKPGGNRLHQPPVAGSGQGQRLTTAAGSGAITVYSASSPRTS
jgi:hypothetical protein